VTALLGLATLEEAVALFARVRARLPSLQAADFFLADGLALVCAHRGIAPPFAHAHPVYVLLECGDAEDPIDALGAALEDEPARDVAVADDSARRAALWTYREAHNEALNAAGIPHKLDVSVPMSALAAAAAAIVAAVEAAAPDARTILYGHLGDGNLHVNVLGPDPEDDRIDELVLRLVAAHGGSISAEHGVGVAKRRWLGLTRTAEERAAMAALKHALDPAGLLNPGAVL
jgi:FAD/FMN-containing dehydrogenase